MSTDLPTDLPIYSFASADDFEAYLERENTVSSGIYLKLAKKVSGVPSVSASEAVEVALCFGWIDGRANRVDDQWWLVRYTPRRSKSIWSQKNVQTVQRLLEADRMRPAGAAAVEAAKADGRWERAYAGPATITVPEDFATALEASPAATRLFEGMNRSERYSVLWRVHTASPKTRAKRIGELMQMLAVGECPGTPKVKLINGAKLLNRSGKVEKSIIEKKLQRRPVRSQTANTAAPAQASRRSGLRSRHSVVT